MLKSSSHLPPALLAPKERERERERAEAASSPGRGCEAVIVHASSSPYRVVDNDDAA